MYRCQKVILSFATALMIGLSCFAAGASEQVSREMAWDYLIASGEVEMLDLKIDQILLSLSQVYTTQKAEIYGSKQKLKAEFSEKMIQSVQSSFSVQELKDITGFLKGKSGAVWRARKKDYQGKVDSAMASAVNALNQQFGNAWKKERETKPTQPSQKASETQGKK